MVGYLSVVVVVNIGRLMNVVVVWSVHHAWNLVPACAVDDWKIVWLTLVLGKERHMIVLYSVERLLHRQMERWLVFANECCRTWTTRLILNWHMYTLLTDGTSDFDGLSNSFILSLVDTESTTNAKALVPVLVTTSTAS